MRYCKYCGMPVDEETIYCPKCGNKLIDDNDIRNPFLSEKVEIKKNINEVTGKKVKVLKYNKKVI